MMEEDDGAASGRSSPPTPKKVKVESEEPIELLKAGDHSEDESKEIEDDDGDEDEDEDGSPPGWQRSPLLLDMGDLPPSSPLPPTPPLPSSPRDLNMEQQDSEDEGPPPGWDNTYQIKEQVEQTLTPFSSADISDIKMEDLQQDARNGDGHPSPVTEPLPSDMKVEEQDSEDEGPPPGWDSKCQPESELQVAYPTVNQLDVKTVDVQQVPSDIKMEEQDSEDEGPPPGWDSKCQPPSPTITQSDIKTENLQQDVQNGNRSDIKVEEQDSEDEGPPPGWDAKCQLEPESTITQSDMKTEDIQQDDPQPPPQLLPLAIKVEEQDSEDEGPPPGWDSKCQPEPELQTANPTTPPSDSKIEGDRQEDEGPPPGWEQQSQDHSNLPSPILPSGAKMEFEQKNVESVVERQQSTPPMKPPAPVHVHNPEMGQMVCGSCRRLLSYPKGARYVECGCCLEENYVLEEHEVGQVICGGCDVLLMYPYGAPKVRCVNCSTETEIGDQNRRPSLAEQQRRGRRHLKRVQMGKC
ncbi:hypothetical protein L2E82_40049 [Cichorium intybus]|uniref:Uncharacterized protein n=1 Tax=Cichorium intybus TaxID=13427 RepID=A0ACB9AJY0_CICIN|nr:hypothetical protein L2E82_40049 [Cichorium intybus]